MSSTHQPPVRRRISMVILLADAHQWCDCGCRDVQRRVQGGVQGGAANNELIVVEIPKVDLLACGIKLVVDDALNSVVPGLRASAREVLWTGKAEPPLHEGDRLLRQAGDAI